MKSIFSIHKKNSVNINCKQLEDKFPPYSSMVSVLLSMIYTN